MVNESAVVVFDDERAVANAGVMLPALLAGRLGIERLVDGRVDLGERSGAANPGRKVMTMLSAMHYELLTPSAVGGKPAT
jgi:hypothetical protein